MRDNQEPQEHKIVLGIHWTPGAVKVVLAIIAGGSGIGGLAWLWDRLSVWVHIAPVVFMLASHPVSSPEYPHEYESIRGEILL